MVKPVFPQWHPQRHQAHERNNAERNNGEEDPLNASLDTYTRHGENGSSSGFSLSDDGVFSSLSDVAPTEGRARFESPAFQSYDGSLPFTLPTPSPRERISSLPEGEEDETRPLPRQRRRSAPVGIEFAGGPSFSTTDPEGTGGVPPALQDVASKGQELFWFILSEEVKAQEAAAPGSFSALTISPSSQRMEVLNERGRFGGRTLRQIAEAFSHSSQRMRVREHAERVHLQSLNYNSFSDLLFGLFQEGGVTQARVLVLFFFCADVALRALRENLTYHFQQLVDWTSRYITERLSAWVLEHGGWAAVLQESMDQAYKLAVIGVCVLGIVALSAFAFKHR